MQYWQHFLATLQENDIEITRKIQPNMTKMIEYMSSGSSANCVKFQNHIHSAIFLCNHVE
jgi:hypothetical protein